MECHQAPQRLGQQGMNRGTHHVLARPQQLQIFEGAVHVTAVLPPEPESFRDRPVCRFPNCAMQEYPVLVVGPHAVLGNIGDLHAQVSVRIRLDGPNRQMIARHLTGLELCLSHAPRSIARPPRSFVGRDLAGPEAVIGACPGEPGAFLGIECHHEGCALADSITHCRLVYFPGRPPKMRSKRRRWRIRVEGTQFGYLARRPNPPGEFSPLLHLLFSVPCCLMPGRWVPARRPGRIIFWVGESSISPARFVGAGLSGRNRFLSLADDPRSSPDSQCCGSRRLGSDRS